MPPFRSLLRFIRATPLPNTGSVARDLLASERTFLSWARTGLGFIALGVALEKVEALAALSPTLLHLQDSRTKLAAGVLVGAGSLCVGHGTLRYFSTLELVKQGKFRPNTGGVTLMAITCIGIAIAGSILVIENEADKAREKAKEEGTQVKI
ncbi:hypothetical protein H2200_006855 [Cladophialophora chaetospira]|uniref:DUF202 domain-containing protein n=1 Tax=Cladophialophora chaetospira TaxID=386627 RepID=A0AA38X9K3_9EURO|nr:hypothetical protein H2200_006855 [Cladophialophora chaetospira]